MTFRSLFKISGNSRLQTVRWLAVSRISPQAKMVESSRLRVRNFIKRKNGRRQNFLNINTVSLHLKLNTVKGSRYRFKLPVNGQRSKTNANTCKRSDNV